MRSLLAVFLLVFALPAFAQQEPECRGKQPFDLGGGVTGCLLDVGTTEITKTRTRDDGASSSTRDNTAGQIRVLLFGAYDGSKRVISRRITAVCKAFLPNLKAEMAGTRFHQVVVVLVWPRVANPGDFVPVANSKVAIQPAFSSAACRGVKFFS
ncbi:hypothetical protein [Tateyamaria pelophila]|uniref:hypothetical protein n=1 Tax=Tateyamaria pelophila TaxID=328415 RepID=UPI001CBABBBC|nr:hypothetical protein [Tateyamaria pelophila]